MRHSKLVRDKIPEIIRKSGEFPNISIAGEEEYWQKLKEKLQEEVDEFIKDEKEEELVDILEVINAITEFKKIDKDKLEHLRGKKAEEKGRFKERIILEKS